jgi:hypothetical protein
MITLGSRAARTALLRLDGLSAQSVIDVIQDVAYSFELFGGHLNYDNRFWKKDYCWTKRAIPKLVDS